MSLIIFDYLSHLAFELGYLCRMKKINYKKTLLYCSLFFLSSALFGQVDVDQSTRYDYFNGFGHSNTIAYVITHEEKVYDKKILVTLDLTGKELNRIIWMKNSVVLVTN